MNPVLEEYVEIGRGMIACDRHAQECIWATEKQAEGKRLDVLWASAMAKIKDRLPNTLIPFLQRPDCEPERKIQYFSDSKEYAPAVIRVDDVQVYAWCVADKVTFQACQVMRDEDGELTFSANNYWLTQHESTIGETRFEVELARAVEYAELFHQITKAKKEAGTHENPDIHPSTT